LAKLNRSTRTVAHIHSTITIGPSRSDALIPGERARRSGNDLVTVRRSRRPG